MFCKIIVLPLHHQSKTDILQIDNDMNTQETAQMTQTPYFIEYVWPKDAYGNQSFYYQLVRKSDLAILYANPSIDKVYIECWRCGIAHNDVTIW